jgi:site-specific DNA-cytosine methylase
MAKKKEKIKYGSIVPLIGGMTIANKDVTGVDPAFLLSYDAFKGNDSHCVNYFKKTPYMIIDAESNTLPEDEDYGDMFSNVDFVSTVCPCAGLSMLNANNGEGGKARGSDAVQNEWMYKTANFVLEQIQPKVFWGENAPGLYTAMGAGVVERMKEIGEKFGYSFSVIKTNTFLHGIPQNRIRSFYFFWKDSEAPILEYKLKDAPTLESYLSEIPEGTSFMDRGFGLGDLSTNPWVRFVKSKGMSMKEAMATEDRHSLLQIILANDWLEEGIQWGQENEAPEVEKFLSHVKYKISLNKGWWDGTPLVFNEATNAIIAKNAGIVHPNGERGITVREAMWLMGLPHDFQLVEGGHWNHICQNVPVKTASDWTREVISFIKGEKTEFGGKFLKQNNISKKVDFAEKTEKSKVLF